MGETAVIIDYGSGNLRSVQKAVERASLNRADKGISTKALVTHDPDLVRKADRIILPGVGAFRACAEGLKAHDGLSEALREAVIDRARPFLGVCVGMQLLANCGLEYGKTEGLGWVDGVVRPLPASDDVRSPHMGWNTVTFRQGHRLFDQLPRQADFYFAHSYYFDIENDHELIGTCHNGIEFSAAIARDNIAACQFHPEKSQVAGLALIGAFLQWQP